jgi:hypothetical protein
MIAVLVHVIIVLAILGFLWWLIVIWLLPQIPIPEPFGTIIKACLAIIAVLIVLGLLMPLIGNPIPGLHFG